MKKEIKQLMSLFQGSFINQNNELILVPRTNLYFRLDDVNTKEDLIYKIIAWCSRDASKSEPFRKQVYNENYRKSVRNALDSFLNVGWTEERWLELYSRYGNGIREKECRKMIENNF